MFSIPGGWEWIIIGLIVFLIFGKRLPGIMKNAGRSIAEFWKGFKNVEKEINEVKEIKGNIDTITKFKIN